MPHGVVVFRTPEVYIGILWVACVVGEVLIGLEAEALEIVVVAGERSAEM